MQLSERGAAFFLYTSHYFLLNRLTYRCRACCRALSVCAFQMQREIMSILRLLRPILMKRLNENAPDYRLCCVPPTIIDLVSSGGMPLAEGGG